MAKQVARLEGLKAGKMKAELAEWVSQRLAILKQYAKAQDASPKDL